MILKDSLIREIRVIRVQNDPSTTPRKQDEV